MSDVSNKEQVLRITIFGEEYPIRGYADREHILRVAEYVDKKMREIALKSKNRSSNKIAVLTALNLADELLELKQEKDSDLNQVEDRAKNILEMLDSSLPDLDGS
jgi:cell division protein ZapA